MRRDGLLPWLSSANRYSAGTNSSNRTRDVETRGSCGPLCSMLLRLRGDEAFASLRDVGKDLNSTCKSSDIQLRKDQATTHQNPITLPESCLRSLYPSTTIENVAKHIQEPFLNQILPTVHHRRYIPPKCRKRLQILLELSVYLLLLVRPLLHALRKWFRELQGRAQGCVTPAEAGRAEVCPRERGALGCALIARAFREVELKGRGRR